MSTTPGASRSPEHDKSEAEGVARQLGNILLGASDTTLAHQTLEEMLRLANSSDPRDRVSAGMLVESQPVADELAVLTPSALDVTVSVESVCELCARRLADAMRSISASPFCSETAASRRK